MIIANSILHKTQHCTSGAILPTTNWGRGPTLQVAGRAGWQAGVIGAEQVVLFGAAETVCLVGAGAAGTLPRARLAQTQVCVVVGGRGALTHARPARGVNKGHSAQYRGLHCHICLIVAQIVMIKVGEGKGAA